MPTPLIVNADDYGLTDATSRSIIEAHRTGIVTSTSALAVVPGIDGRMAWLDEVPALSVGVHLALVGEDPPVLSAGEIPTLVDDRGALAPSWRALLPRLAAGRIDPDDIRREFAAQIDVVDDLVEVRHLDTHQHVHLWPSVGRVVVELAQERGITRVRVPAPSEGGVRGASLRRLAQRLAKRLDAAGIAHQERFAGLDEAGGWTKEHLTRTLTVLALAPGSVEVNTHPGALIDPERDRFDWGYRWGEELEALKDPELRRVIDRLGYELVGG